MATAAFTVIVNIGIIITHQSQNFVVYMTYNYFRMITKETYKICFHLEDKN